MPPHADQLRLGERVEVKLKPDEGGAVVFVAVELRRVHGEDREVIVVRRIALGRAGAAVAGNAKIGCGSAPRPSARRRPFGLPAFLGRLVTSGGMLKTTQCQKPLPVGASGS